MLRLSNIQKILGTSFFLLGTSVQLVSTPEVHRAAATYRNSISLLEPRISDIKESLSSESPDFPNSFKLFFKNSKGITRFFTIGTARRYIINIESTNSINPD
ncbi:hypothetical protein LEP1GSC133_0245 [Leptospira borgpetersenii serovar Pomona str. 200901868]|uniref:Uncharacterized protein n=1 Tax=Leptospira borgpetersenii serovar Pomona str. 200901868 TaxID=1192866 RepID=M6VVT0_LEPBO|nr:hypothetical protein LEP1GSC133_0245 [Leptospira borgpetersenii serovar Pomona str. 200901868]